MSKEIKTEVLPQASSSNQERTKTFPKKEVEERPAKNLQQEEEKKTFRFQLKSQTYSVACDASMTVLDALNTSKTFRQEKEKRTNKDKAVLIQISREVSRAAIKTDFPCCLIDDNEIIDVTFIKNDEDASKQRNITGQHSSCSNPDMFVTFYIKKKGGEKVKILLESEALRDNVEYVCVYAHKEETLREALKRDGRFKKIIFKKHCGLLEDLGKLKTLRHEMPHLVNFEELKRKVFEVAVFSDATQSDSEDDPTPQDNLELDEPSDAEVSDDVGTGQNPVNTKQETKQDKNQGKSTGSSAKRPVLKVIPNSEEILGILRDQFKGLLKKLKERENLKNKSQVQKFFREEFDKSVEDFLEVKKVKVLMNLSKYVCQIRKKKEGEREEKIGTGFLLFNRFLLTNAHVLRLNECITVNPTEFTAVFFYEDEDENEIKRVPIERLVSNSYNIDEKGNRLDYALLELKLNNEKCPELLSHYKNILPNNRSQICIVGHPDGGVKKMDPCFVIGKENLQVAVEKHESENAQFIHIISQRSVEDNWKVYENQITYDSCFFHGSSGSPVFDADCKLIGIHTGGYVYPEGKKTRSVKEYAYAMQPILDDIKAKARLQGNKEILDILEGNSNESSNEEQQIQTEIPMETEQNIHTIESLFGGITARP